jgi:hypothetical protein
MRDSLVGQRLVWGFLLGVVLLNDPVLSLFDRGQQLGGIPLVYVYLFVVWAGLIGLLAWTLKPGAADEREGGR